MILFHSPLTMALLLAAVCLVLVGTLMKRGHALSLLGAAACAAAVLTGLLSGAGWQEALLYVLLPLIVPSLQTAMEGGGADEL